MSGTDILTMKTWLVTHGYRIAPSAGGYLVDDPQADGQGFRLEMPTQAEAIVESYNHLHEPQR